MPEPATTLHTLSPSRAREAELLADMLRISRLTILYGEAGVGKTTLLVNGVLPLLGRRGADREGPRLDEAGVVVPFAKCRRRDRSAQAEIAVFFDAWNDAPLATLTERLVAALPRGRAQLDAQQSTLSGTLTALSRELGARFLILLDRFEEYLTAPPDRPGIPEFADELLAMLQNPQLPANFLVSVQEYAEPLMERLRARVRGLGDASLRLDRVDKRAPAIVQSLEEHEHARARRAHGARLEGSPARPPLAGAAPQSADTLETSSPNTLVGSEAPPETPSNGLEGAQYQWAVTCELVPEAIAYATAQNMWITFGAAQHEWKLAFELAGQTTAALQRASAAEGVAVAEAPPPVDGASSDAFERTTEESTAPGEAAAPENVLASGAVPQQPDPAPALAPEENGLEAEAPEMSAAEPLVQEMAGSNDSVSIGTPEESLSSEQASVESPAMAEPAVVRESRDLQTYSKRSGKRWVSFAKGVAAAGAVTSLGLVVWTLHNIPLEQLPEPISADTATTQRAPEAAREAPPPQPALPPLPPIALVTEPGNSTDAQIAGDLGHVTAAERSVHVAHRADILSWPSDEAARLAIVRYEALEAANRARARTGKGNESIRVVTALYTEEIHILARRDSPLNFIYEIENAKLNVGPSSGSRGLTAARLYERMFGKPIPQANISVFSDDEALNKLVNEKSIDAMIVIAGQPSAWLAELPPQLASSIKLLKHDRQHPAGQRAIEAYLPTTIRSASYGKWLRENTPALATLTFLVGTEGGNAEALGRFDLFVQSFCRNMDRLRLEGHPKWREVQLGFEIDTGWPYSARAKSAFRTCLANARARSAPAPR